MPLIGSLKDLFPGNTWLFWIVLIAAMAASVVWFHWLDALKEAGRDRDRLLRRLRRGGDWRAQYVWRLRRFLAHVDRFLGDARRPGRACRWLTGGGPWPCWTAASFDRCALMAVVYPFLSLYATWLISGEAGDLGEMLKMLKLRVEPNPGVRIVQMALIGFMPYAFIKFMWSSGSMNLVWGIVFMVVFMFPFAVTGAFPVAFAFAAPGPFAVIIAVAVPFAVAVAGAGSVTFAGVIIFAGAGAFTIQYIAKKVIEKGRLALFWICYWPLMLAASLGGLWIMTRYHSSKTAVIFLVMLALIPLVNIPFDWASIGVTRGLLRRGSARGASPALPFLLGIADFLLGLALLLPLACALVLALHTADAVMLAAGADRPLIDVPARLLALGQKPYDPQNWWVYLTLFSTLIPSALNLAIGMISLATVSSQRHRHSLIRRIEHLNADGKGEGGTRFEILVSLAAPVFLGTLATGLLIWGTTLLLLHAGGKMLWWFLGHIAWVEWLMMTR